MVKLCNLLPFPFASAREKRAHQMRTEPQPATAKSKSSRMYRPSANAGRCYAYKPARIEQDSGLGDDDGSTTNKAFFGDRGPAQSVFFNGAENQQKGAEGGEDVRAKGKTPATRLKKKIRGLDLQALNGLVTPPTRPRMRICSLNSRHQTLPEKNAPAASQSYSAINSRALLITAVCMALCFITHPVRTLQLILTALMFFASFPEWMPWWTALLTMVLPMGLQARVEVTMSLCMVVWIGGLEWVEAWRRVVRWVCHE